MPRWMPLAVAALLAGCAPAPQPRPELLPADHNGPPELPPAMPRPAASDEISTERMSEITRVLSLDDFQGRAPGTPGEDKTVTYLIQQFHMAGRFCALLQGAAEGAGELRKIGCDERHRYTSHDGLRWAYA